MINGISSWAKSIVLAVIIATILEMILPDTNNKKYIKTVIGIYILFTVVSPIISKLNKNSFNLSKYEDYLKVNTAVTTSTNSVDMSLDKAYISNIKLDIKNRLKEQGYEVKNINVEAELKDNTKYGEIKKISLNLSKMDNQENVSKIEKVIINVNEENSATNNISETEKVSLKSFLKETYNISEKNIDIGG